MRLFSVRKLSAGELEAYADILSRFKNSSVHQSDPASFLSSLNTENIELLKRVHSVGDMTRDDVSTMSREEATNFIVPDSERVDLNDDGFVSGYGGGKSFMFPPPNAPQSVKDAWSDTTKNMSEEDQMMLSGKFLMALTLPNMQRNENGSVTAIEPGAPGWRNIYSEPGFSYADTIDKFLQGNEASRPYNTQEM